MLLRTASTLLAFTLTTSSTLAFQAGEKAAMAGRITELKDSIAANKARLAKYQWTETTTVLFRGQARKTETSTCHYGPDGKVVKLPNGPAAPALGGGQMQQQRGGLRGRIIEKKTEEMKDYGERLKSLIGEYVPPNRDKVQDAFQAGNASIAPAAGTTSMTLANYYKSGDKMIFAFDPTAKKIRSLNVDTYLDNPQTDIVTLAVNFASLPDGTNYAASTNLKAESKEIEIRTANSNYQKITP